MPNFLNYFRKAPTIFINYRRDDTKPQAEHLRDNLKTYFKQKVKFFLDETDIKGGDSYKDLIENAIRSSAVFLVVIGKIWVEIENSKTKVRRLDEKEDFVKKEIKLAIDIDIPIIPVLLNGAEVLNEDDLPDELKKLVDIQVVKFGAKWSDGVKELSGIIEEKLEQSPYSLDYRKIIITAVLIPVIGFVAWWLLPFIILILGNSNTNVVTSNVNKNVTNIGTPIPVPILLPTIEPPAKNCDVKTHLPEKNDLYKIFNPDNENRDDQWGCELTIRAIEKLAQAWKEKYPDAPLIQIGDISERDRSNPGKAERHENGIAFDIRPLRKDKEYIDVNTGNSQYSRDLTMKLVLLIKGKLPNASIYFDDNEWGEANLIISEGKKDTHLHVELD